MTAPEALHRMRTEVDELERKQLLRPSLIAAKRQWVATVEHELHHLQQQLAMLEQRMQEQRQHHRETDLRLGMLANVLTILGFDPMMHLRKPLHGSTYTNPEVYQLAAQQIDQLRDRRRPYSRTTHNDLRDLLAHAIWSARLELQLRPFKHLLNQAHGQEEERTAA